MFEVEIMQIFETLDNMERTLDAPSEIFAIMRDDLNNALFSECSSYGNCTPSQILDMYMDNCGEFSLMAKTEQSRMRFESLASLAKKLKDFYIFDLFDKNLNHPYEDDEAYARLCNEFEKKYLEAC